MVPHNKPLHLTASAPAHARASRLLDRVRVPQVSGNVRRYGEHGNMAQFLTTHGVASEIERLIMGAQKRLTLVTPFLKLSAILYWAADHRTLANNRLQPTAPGAMLSRRG